MTKEYNFLKCEDGIYFGRPLKNGNISKDSIKVSDEDIIQLFIEYLERYCLTNNTNLLQIQNKNKDIVVEAKLHLSNFYR